MGRRKRWRLLGPSSGAASWARSGVLEVATFVSMEALYKRAERGSLTSGREFDPWPGNWSRLPCCALKDAGRALALWFSQKAASGGLTSWPAWFLVHCSKDAYVADLEKRLEDLKDPMPPFVSLRVFEAAARSGSFARAAEELGISAGAVSQHIRSIEEFAGQPLFRRLGRGVELTEAGKSAFAHASAAMAEMLQAGRAMRSALRGRRISISTAPSFASKWLIPRLSQFQELYPDTEVRMSADMTLTDFAGSDMDLAIRYGPGGYEGLHCERLMTESVIVVCSPRLLEGHPGAKTAADLISLPLIHDDAPERDPSCPTWNMWFAARGLRRADAERGLRFNQSSLAIEAAIAGKGLALAKRQLALGDMAEGRLVAPLSEADAPVNFAYWLVWPRGRRFEPAQMAFLDWLRAQAIEGDSAADHTA